MNTFNVESSSFQENERSANYSSHYEDRPVKNITSILIDLMMSTETYVFFWKFSSFLFLVLGFLCKNISAFDLFFVLKLATCCLFVF